MPRPAVAVASLFLPLGLLAQGASPPRALEDPPIPRELVTALLSSPRVGMFTTYGGANDGQIWVGTIPQNLSRQLYVPTTARVIGGSGAGTTMSAVISYPMNYDALRTVMRLELTKLGWMQPPPMNMGGGFRMLPPQMDTTIMPSQLCQGVSSLAISVAKREISATTLVLSVSAGAGYSVCAPPNLGTAPGYVRPGYPTLFYPSAATFPPTGNCFPTGGYNGTSGAVVTAMSSAELLEHISSQMRDSGWTARSDGVAISGRVWTKPDSTGKPMEISITVRGTATAGSCKELQLQLRK